jgi:hypothetical protein
MRRNTLILGSSIPRAITSIICFLLWMHSHHFICLTNLSVSNPSFITNGALVSDAAIEFIMIAIFEARSASTEVISLGDDYLLSYLARDSKIDFYSTTGAKNVGLTLDSSVMIMNSYYGCYYYYNFGADITILITSATDDVIGIKMRMMMMMM